MNYKLIVSFDGTQYQGWQRLKAGDCTIQGKIEECLSKMAGYKVLINGCGRTDAGVHALKYCANVNLKKDFEPEYIKSYLNKFLPKDINISECCVADERFHARLNVRKKVYTYRIWNSEEHNVFERKYLYDFQGVLDIEKMREAAALFCGKHDFSGFCSNKNYKKSTERTIYSVDIIKNGSEISIMYTGSGFLYNMVRIMTGTLIEIGNEKRGAESINNIYASGKREEAGFTAPAHGLVLTDVIYD